MKVIQEMNLAYFDFWAGARERASMLSGEELNLIGEELDARYPEGMDDTAINDLFWFDFGMACSLIGLEYDEELDEIIR